MLFTNASVCVSRFNLFGTEFVVLVYQRRAVSESMLLFLQHNFVFVLTNVPLLLVDQRTVLLELDIVIENCRLDL